MMLAMGMTFVIIAGGIDLSVGSIVGLSGGVVFILLTTFKMNLWLALLIGVLCSALCGLLNGAAVTKLGLIPFIATLGGQWVYRGILKLLNNGGTISIRNIAPEEAVSKVSFLGSGRLLGIPVPVYVVAFFAVLLTFLLKRTTYGRSVYAIGSNKEAAAMSGINVKLVTLKTFILAGIMAGIAGILLASRMVSVQSSAGTGYEFEGIFSAVVGGVSMAGGEGSVLGAIVGALIVATLRNGLNLNGINSFWQQVILGILIIVVVYVDSLKTKKRASV